MIVSEIRMKYKPRIDTKKKRRIFMTGIIILVAVILITMKIYHENNIVETTQYSVHGEGLPQSFDGFRIVQISDFHNTQLGEENCLIVDAVKELEPDIIVLTGDYIDSRHTDVSIARELTEQLVKIAPVYYITGNHESRIPMELLSLTEDLEELGVHILRNCGEHIVRGGEEIQIIGVDDVSFFNKTEDEIDYTVPTKIISELEEPELYTILLSHQPRFIDYYKETGVDLVFSGHEHGGQFRIPFVGGLFAPGDGLFPKYSEGVITQDKTTMVVSRGLGQSLIPFRVNNSPEVVCVTLSAG